MSKKKVMAKQPEPVLYCGPTINGVAIQGTVYDAVPAAVLEIRADVPEVSNLFIPIAEYGKAERQIREGKGYIALSYQAALQYKAKNNR